MNGIAAPTIAVRTLLSVLAMTSFGAAQQADIVSAGHAKSITVLRASFPNRGELHSFGLAISSDGETFVDAKAGPLRGLRFTGEMKRGLNETPSAIVLVPIVGRFAQGTEGFLFEKAGT